MNFGINWLYWFYFCCGEKDAVLVEGLNVATVGSGTEVCACVVIAGGLMETR